MRRIKKADLEDQEFNGYYIGYKRAMTIEYSYSEAPRVYPVSGLTPRCAALRGGSRGVNSVKF